MWRLRNSKGFGLVEMMIAVTILLTVSTWGAWRYAQEAKRDKGRVFGDHMTQLNQATASYIKNNYTELSSAAPVVPGYTNPMQPTLAELRANNLLANGFGDTNVFGSGYTIRISKVPTGCVPPNCDVTGMTLISSPVLLPGTATPDTATLSAAAKRVGGDAAYSEVAATLVALGGAWNAVNPLNQAGIFAVRTGYGSEMSLDDLYPRNGSRPLTANLAGGGNSIDNVVNVNATGTVYGAAGNFTGNVTAGGNVTATGTVSGGTVNSSGNMTAAGTVTGATVNSTGNMTANGTVQGSTDVRGPRFTDTNNNAYYLDPNGTSNIADATFNTVVTEGTACAPNGRVARDAVGLLLSCQSGVWKKASGSSGLGIGQTWQDVTASRSYGVTYTNGTSNPIEVSVTGHVGGVPGWCQLDLYVQGVLVGRQHSGGGSYSQDENINGIVPPGATYFTTSVNCSLLSWAELR